MGWSAGFASCQVPNCKYCIASHRDSWSETVPCTAQELNGFALVVAMAGFSEVESEKLEPQSISLYDTLSESRLRAELINSVETHVRRVVWRGELIRSVWSALILGSFLRTDKMNVYWWTILSRMPRVFGRLCECTYATFRVFMGRPNCK